MTPAAPHVVLVVADDMGYSDLGCYGGEIATPTLDRLGRAGARLSSFYNTARCSPSRASLLTGLHPHQTGVGILTNDDRPDGYPGRSTAGASRSRSDCGTRDTRRASPASGTSPPTSGHRPTPGRHAGASTASSGPCRAAGVTIARRRSRAGKRAPNTKPAAPGFFYTDAITEEAAAFVRGQAAREPGRPVFLYVAYTAPHWPLHAPAEDIARYRGVFDAGWDDLREARFRRLVAEGLVPAGTSLSGRDPSQPAWRDAPDPAWQLGRMRVYAAQIDRMDRGIGRIVEALAETGALADTLFLFLSDNGASAEDLPLGDPDAFRRRHSIVPPATWAGAPLRIGNTPDVESGPEDTYASYGRAWANLSNTPFRYYKRWVHEGGIATPFIAHWPAGGIAPGVIDAPFQLVDVVPTVLEAAGVTPEAVHGARDRFPLEGQSMLPALRGGRVEPRTLYWEHVGNAAVRRGRWRLVREHGRAWELYDVDLDRAELRDLAASHPAVVAELAAAWSAWASRVGVIPWEQVEALYRREGKGDPHG